MGLSIYYTISASKARMAGLPDVEISLGRLQEYMRQRAQEVGAVVTYHSGMSLEQLPYFEEPDPVASHQFGEFVSMLLEHEGPEAPIVPTGFVRCIMPQEAAGFGFLPGTGCETAWVSLGRYPASLAGIPTKCGERWYGSGFCKTQYACLTGTENFLRSHRSVVAMLDYAKKIGFDVEAGDDSGYWEHRNEEKLLDYLEYMNRTLAAFAGAFKDAIDEITPERKIRAPILDHPRFEYLEAQGVEELRRRREL